MRFKFKCEGEVSVRGVLGWRSQDSDIFRVLGSEKIIKSLPFPGRLRLPALCPARCGHRGLRGLSCVQGRPDTDQAIIDS